MKRNIISLAVLIVISATAVANPVIEISAMPNNCVNQGPVTLVARGDTAGATKYTWMYYRAIDTTWVTIEAGMNPTLTVEDFPTYDRAYMVAVTINGRKHYSNNVVLCHCGVVPVKVLSFIGEVVNGYPKVTFSVANMDIGTAITLQSSTDGRIWTDIIDMTSKRAYVSDQKLQGTLFYRLKFITKDGSESYSPIRTVYAALPQHIDTKMPFDVDIFTIGGQPVKKIRSVMTSAANLNMVTDSLIKHLTPQIYIVVFIQPGIKETKKAYRQQ